MRELDECTAEVFRRSEQRIKERRKKRSRVLALCIPVCLIAAVGSAVIFPSMTPEMGSDSFSQAAGEAAGNAPESLACPYIAVEIQDAGLFPQEHYGKVTDQLAVAEMFRAIHSLFAEIDSNDQMNNENLPASEDEEHHDLTESAGKSKGYTITFTAEDGSQTVYKLSENTLLNVSTNEAVFLGDARAGGLMAVLGISE